MNAMIILIRCRSAEADKRRLRQRIEQRREAMTCITPRMDAVGGSRGGSSGDKIGNLMADVSELEGALAAREEAHRVEVAAACALLDLLPESESAVMYSFYVSGSKVPLIAKQLGFTDGYVRKLKAEGMKRLSELQPEAVTAALPGWYLDAYPGPAFGSGILQGDARAV